MQVPGQFYGTKINDLEDDRHQRDGVSATSWLKPLNRRHCGGQVLEGSTHKSQLEALSFCPCPNIGLSELFRNSFLESSRLLKFGKRSLSTQSRLWSLPFSRQLADLMLSITE